MGEVLQLQRWAQFEVLACTNCGVEVGYPGGFLDQRRKDTREFYCINGHVMSWHETEATKLRKQLEQKEREVTFQREQRQLAERQLSTEKGKRTKLERRIARGVCPHCQRSFTNVARHMQTKHPECAE